VAKAIGQPSSDERADGGNDEDGDGADLGRGARVAHFTDDSWDEERARVTCVDNSHVHDNATIDLPICEDAAGCFVFCQLVSVLEKAGGCGRRNDRGDTYSQLYPICSSLLLQSRSAAV